jgi:hypothetical protein
VKVTEAPDPRVREELEAALGARRELGADFESQVVEAFLARVEREIDARVDARLAERRGAERADKNPAAGVALASIGMGIPITAIAGGTSGIPGILIVWIGIVLVNVAHALARRR